MRDTIVSTMSDALGLRGSAETFVSDDGQSGDVPGDGSGLSPATQESMKTAVVAMTGSAPGGAEAIVTGALQGIGAAERTAQGVSKLVAAGTEASTAANVSKLLAPVTWRRLRD